MPCALSLLLAGLPWPSSQPLLAPPRLTRPLADAWLVSATLHLLDPDALGRPATAAQGPTGTTEAAAPAVPVSAALCRALGWGEPPRTSVVCAQLLELGRIHGLVRPGAGPGARP